MPGLGSTSSGNGLPSNVLTKTGAYTAAVGDLVQCDVSGGGFTVTLPSSPSTGALVAVKKIDASGNTVTIAPAGSGSIDGSATATTATRWAGVVLEHIGSDVWRICASMTTTGPQGAQGVQGSAGSTGSQGAQGAQGAQGSAGSGSANILRRPSGYFSSPFAYSGNGSGSTRTTGNMEFSPLVVPVAFTLSEIYIKISVGAAGSSHRIGIYNDSNGLPGTLLAELGTIDGSSASIVGITGLSQALAAGNYWLAHAQQGAGNATIWSGGGAGNVADSRATGQYILDNLPPSAYNTSGNTYTGALPDPAPTLAAATQNNAVRYALKAA